MWRDQIDRVRSFEKYRGGGVGRAFSPVHARELANVRKRVLEAVRELERVDVTQPELQKFAHFSATHCAATRKNHPHSNETR